VDFGTFPFYRQEIPAKIYCTLERFSPLAVNQQSTINYQLKKPDRVKTRLQVLNTEKLFKRY